jgi:hypothetical protein
MIPLETVGEHFVINFSELQLVLKSVHDGEVGLHLTFLTGETWFHLHDPFPPKIISMEFS